MKKLILIGGGGHCKSCIDVIESTNEFKIEGILDKNENIGKNVLGYPIIGNDSDIDILIKKGNQFLITIGHMTNPSNRIKLFTSLSDFKALLPAIISKIAYVSDYTKISAGTIVMHHALVNANSVVGKNCIINSKALIEHECIIGDNCHISTGARINGQVRIGNNCFIGSGTIVYNNIQISENVNIAAGSIVRKSIKEPGTYGGNPFRKVSKWK